MKTFLLVAGIVCLVAAAFTLLFAFLHIYMYYNLLDGSPEHYASLRRSSAVFLTVGVILALAGAACLIIYAKI